jgi:hypothetical protein
MQPGLMRKNPILHPFLLRGFNLLAYNISKPSQRCTALAASLIGWSGAIFSLLKAVLREGYKAVVTLYWWLCFSATHAYTGRKRNINGVTTACRHVIPIWLGFAGLALFGTPPRRRVINRGLNVAWSPTLPLGPSRVPAQPEDGNRQPVQSKYQHLLRPIHGKPDICYIILTVTHAMIR